MSTPRRYISDQRDAAARQTRARILDAAEQELVRRGYHATTVASLARAADVSPQTIYNSVGGKAAVVKALYDVRLAGDDEPVPIEERPELLRILGLPDAAATLRGYITLGRGMYSRVGPILGALLADGPGADTELKAFLDTIETERRIGNASIVSHLDTRFGLPPQLSVEEAVDILWVATSFDLADRLVRRCGWSLDAYEHWVAEVVIASLARAPESTAGRT
jgi:AcrR family transcriptional regulator